MKQVYWKPETALPPEVQINLERIRRERLKRQNKNQNSWPTEYVNKSNNRKYEPHHEAERDFVNCDYPRYSLVRGGEGSGKSVAGVVKTLERLRRGMSGIMVSPDLQHFKKSLWPEFKRWCPWALVVETQQYRGRSDWEPHEPFTLTFKNGAQLLCGGIESPGAWEGPNVSFAHFDEARRARTADALKVLDGRIRIQGSCGELPQLWLTTTPRKNWLYEYFGPLSETAPGAEPDRFESFKRQSRDVVLKTQDNEANTFAGYSEQRGQTLSEAERRVLLEAAWEDIDDVDRFLLSMTLWDNCQLQGQGHSAEQYDGRQAMVIGVDAGIVSDCFAIVGVTRHPDYERDRECVVRLSRVWQPRPGHQVSLDEVEQEIVSICERFNVVQLAYDKYQLTLMMERLYRNHSIWTEEFSQQSAREVADKQLRDMIISRHLHHDGTHADLRQHLDNADIKKSGVEGESRMRLVKREQSAKIDLAVALSMAVARCLELNLS